MLGTAISELSQWRSLWLHHSSYEELLAWLDNQVNCLLWYHQTFRLETFLWKFPILVYHQLVLLSWEGLCNRSSDALIQKPDPEENMPERDILTPISSSNTKSRVCGEYRLIWWPNNSWLQMFSSRRLCLMSTEHLVSVNNVQWRKCQQIIVWIRKFVITSTQHLSHSQLICYRSCTNGSWSS